MEGTDYYCNNGGISVVVLAEWLNLLVTHYHVTKMNWFYVSTSLVNLSCAFIKPDVRAFAQLLRTLAKYSTTK
ncbi:unnamed protein product [Brassica rapa]|uniref:Uncharacterized protein n=2 Tax=Brassica TaxID=3705 RepID=A0A8D9LTV7_BRACM|nr:unnamed protein product [Brassica napus]CAG7886672.1 unnamed protein product [Brassica rapa]